MGRKTERTFVKLVVGILLGSVLIIFLCWAGYRIYAVVESRHLARRATGYISGGDLRQAILSARRALELEPSSVAAMRALADIGERANDKSALTWRRRAYQLAPNSIEDALALVNCLLRFNDVTAAEKLLRQMSETSRRTAGFHAATARLAEAKKNLAEAESHWAEAVKLAPENKSYRLQFALALLRVEDAGKRKTAMSMLAELRTDEKQRAAATRALILDGIAHRDSGQKLAELAHELQGYPEATFSDRLLHLDILRQLRDPLFTQHLTEMEKTAASNPADLAAMLSWMSANGMSLLAIDFARTLPNDAVTKWPTPLSIAEAYRKLADWRKLENLLKEKDWSQFDFLRHAYLSLAFREDGRPVVADREWMLAQKQAGAQPQFLAMLCSTVSGWGWEKETVELLWMLTKQPETQLEAFRALYEKYTEAGDTPGLYRVLMRLADLVPEDRRIQNNLAQLRLLLNADVERAGKTAAEVYLKEPSNPAYASTYAFALYMKGDADEGLEIMNRLSESQLSNPSLAIYYGILLAAGGENEKAKKYLGLAESGKLLPEERALIARTEDSLK